MVDSVEGVSQQSAAAGLVDGLAGIVVRWRVALSFLGVLAIALFVRLYDLGSVPNSLTADETDFFIEIYRYAEGVQKAEWYYQSQFASLAPFGLYAMKWSLDVFGDSVEGLRMYAVLFSMAALVPFFALAYRRTTILVAFAATLMLATNIWYLHFSRTAWTNMNSAFLSIGVLATLTFGLETKRWWWFAAAGALIGLAPYAYVSARVIPFVAALMFPIAALVYRDRLRSVATGFGLAGIIGLAVAAPLILELQQGQWGDYTGRTRTVSIFNDYPDREDGWGAVPEQVQRTFQGFILLSNDDDLFGTNQIFRNSTEGIRYSPPGDLFDLVTRVLFGVGLVAGVWEWRKTALWWPMLLIPLGPQVFSVGTPDGARGLIVVPIIYLFVALGIATLARFAELAFRANRPAMAATSAAVLLLAVGVSVFNVRSYFDWMESPQALADRQPAVLVDEFDEWSAAQRTAAEQNLGSFNTHAWRERQDRAGCLTGRAGGDICSYLALDSTPDALSATLVRGDEAPPGFVPDFLTEISPEEFRRLHGARSEKFSPVLDEMTVEEARAAGYVLPPGLMTATVARLGSGRRRNAS
jgi:hypothetical protein